ncbi:GNAT family N-acetyltransferase [Glaciibacter superstes]|uniref:GNAT family N-acetyltransferase n=1 Tax=Glaciibacter superstes TaxID=501023 RepID=UPI0003B73ECF|nr:GNAT family N-acetyltransferase [Glaciibacter superstes]
MVKTSVRRATDEDLVLLQEIEDEADELFASIFSISGWRPAPPGIERSQQPGFILVASDKPGSEPVGFAHVLGIPGGDHLEQLSVSPSMTRRGHGRGLVEAVKGESGRRGCNRITLRTYADVPWNAPFYASCGFVECAPDTDFLRDLLNAEQQRGLKYGRRVQMGFDLSDSQSR